MQWRKVDEPGPIWERTPNLGGCAHRQPGLAHAPHAHECHEPGLCQRLFDGRHLAASTDEAGQRRWEVTGASLGHGCHGASRWATPPRAKSTCTHSEYPTAVQKTSNKVKINTSHGHRRTRRDQQGRALAPSVIRPRAPRP